MTRRKNKETRKYKPKNEFRYNNSPVAEGHPHFVFGKKNKKFKSLGLTTSPKKHIRNIKLVENPESGNFKNSFLQLRVHTANEKYYSEPLKGWSFSKTDMPIVRHRIKEYKKSVKRSKNKKKR